MFVHQGSPEVKLQTSIGYNLLLQLHLLASLYLVLEYIGSMKMAFEGGFL